MKDIRNSKFLLRSLNAVQPQFHCALVQQAIA